MNGGFDNEGAAIQEARMIITEMDPQRLKYHSRLRDYNNDPAVTFADVQKLFQRVEERLTRRLAGKYDARASIGTCSRLDSNRVAFTLQAGAIAWARQALQLCTPAIEGNWTRLSGIPC